MSRDLPEEAYINQPPCPICGGPTVDFMGDDVCDKCGLVSHIIDEEQA